MAGHREKGSGYADRHPLIEIAKKIKDILQGCEAEGNARSIDDSVHMLVEITAAADNEPEHDELGDFLRYRCTEERCHERADKALRVIYEQPHLTERMRYGKRYEYRQDTKEECFKNLLYRLFLERILPVDII